MVGFKDSCNSKDFVFFSFRVDLFNQFVLVWFHCEITYLYDYNIYIYTYAFVELGPAFPHDVAPGFRGNTDPRYMLERDFALKHCADDPLFQLVVAGRAQMCQDTMAIECFPTLRMEFVVN